MLVPGPPDLQQLVLVVLFIPETSKELFVTPRPWKNAMHNHIGTV